MSLLKKFTIKTVTQTAPTQAESRRSKLVQKLMEQLKVLEAAQKNETFAVEKPRWAKDANGAKSRVTVSKRVKPWFFAKDAGYYLQAKYGSRVISLGSGNSVFVKTLAEVKAALEALISATEAGEMDQAIADLLSSKKPRMKRAA